jgi:DNA-binding NarL/FixJ family response regulator
MSATILIVEDHDAVRASLREWLKAVYPQYRILDASTGERALALAKERPPSLVIMDITLPGISGIEATRRIKATVPAVQVVVLTIHEDEHYRVDAEAAGASAYVPKRTMQTELLPIISALLSQRDPERAQEIGCAIPGASNA